MALPTDHARPAALDASAVSATRATPAVTARIAELAKSLLADLDAVASEINARAITQEPRLVDLEDPSWMEAVWHSTHANVGAILSALNFGVPGAATRPSTGALELFERMADQDDGLTIILRGYRIGIAELWQIWAAHAAGEIDDAGELHAVLATSTSHMLGAIDRVSEELVAQWNDTRQRRRQGLDVSPDELVRAALFAGPGADGALARLGYDEAAHHLAIALPAELEDAEVARLASKLRLIASAESVVLRSDAAWLLWLALDGPLAEHVAAAIDTELAFEKPVGASTPTPGLEGFRSSYREALDARHVGGLRGTGGVTRYRDVALLAVLCADHERARALARTELGPLAEDDEVTARLRETLVAYLACGESHVGAAQRLYVHEKTVAYRVRQAEGLLGRRIGERRAELEAALLVHNALGDQA
jgi:hypothetical protein